MANRILPCPRCQHPQLIVMGVREGICPGCRRPWTLQGALVEKEGATQPHCTAADRIGDSYYFDRRKYTVFAAVTWHDQTFDCESHELYLADEAGDEISLEYEEDDAGDIVWWLDIDATGQVAVEANGGVSYKDKPYTQHPDVFSGYKVVSSAGSFDEAYDVGEHKVVKWYADFATDLGTRRGRLGNTRELGQETWFWMAPIAKPALLTSAEFALARRLAWNKRNVSTLVWAGAALILALVLSSVQSGMALNEQVYSSGLQAYPAQRHWISDTFELKKSVANVRAIMSVRGQLGWFDTPLCLTNLDTQRRYCALLKIDRDSRVGGLGWEDEVDFSRVPGGRYVLEGQAETDGAGPVQFDARLLRDAPRRSTLLIVLAFIIGAPVLWLALSAARMHLRTRDPGETAQVVFFVIVMIIVVWLDWL